MMALLTSTSTCQGTFTPSSPRAGEQGGGERSKNQASSVCSKMYRGRC